MVNKKVKKLSYSDLTWFELSKYLDFFPNLTLDRLIIEIQIRYAIRGLISFNEEDLKKIPISKIDYLNNCLRQIQLGNPVLSKYETQNSETDEDDEKDEIYSNLNQYINKLAEPHCFPLFKYQIEPIVKFLLDRNELVIFDKNIFVREQFLHQLVYEDNDNSFRFIEDAMPHVFFSAQLKDATDEEIIASFRKLLPKIREELNIPHPIYDKEKVTDNIIKKIFLYRVIPLFDLVLWATLNDINLQAKDIAQIIFPIQLGDTKGEEQISDTIYPFMLKVISDEFLNGLKEFKLQLDDYKKDISINRWIEIN